MPSRKQPRPKPFHRPSDKEKCQKVSQAIAALDDENAQPIIIADRHNQMAFEFLEVEQMDDVLDWIRVCLDEIQQIGSAECFVGTTAPRCRHKGFKDLFLFAYQWQSPSLGELTYLKFAIKKVGGADGTSHLYCHLDIHAGQA